MFFCLQFPEGPISEGAGTVQRVVSADGARKRSEED